MKQAVKINTNGTTEVLDLTAGESELRVLQTAVDGLIEPVRIRADLDMYVNEEGLFRADLDLNGWALVFAGVPIRGNVVITGVVDDNGETIGLTDAQVASLMS